MMKCPFHGIIIPRDSYGKPLDSSADPAVKVKTWEDIEAAVNKEHGLIDPRQKKKRSNLMPVNEESDTVVNRMLKKSKKLQNNRETFTERE